MKFRLRKKAGALLVVAWCISSASLANGAVSEHDKMVEGAKREGRLVLYTGMETDEANIFIKEFTKKYPFVKSDIFRSAGERVQQRFRGDGIFWLPAARSQCKSGQRHGRLQFLAGQTEQIQRRLHSG